MNLKDYLDLNRMSYREAAKAWGISHTSIYNWIYGKTKCRKKFKDLLSQVTKGQVNI